MTTIHVRLVVGETALQQLLRRLNQGKNPAGADRGAANFVQNLLVSRPADALAEAEYTVVYTTDREP